MDEVIVTNGRMPRLGFGTWQLTGADCVEGVKHALELGYRHIDTAAVYNNEEAVGRGIREAGVDRESIFLVTKLWHTDLRPGAVHTAVRDSLRRLETDHVDLMHIHWPSTDGVPLADTLGALDEAREQGLVRHVGVCNFTPTQVKQAAALTELLTVQVEYHPFLSQDDLLHLCRRHGLALTAYSPLARGRVLDHPVLQDIAREHDATPAQVALAWLLGKDSVSVIPKAASAEHRATNLAASGMVLDPDSIRRIEALADGGRIVDPSFAPAWEHPAAAAR
jgi:2,5-diketo-D-gluconate reductase B